MLSSIKMTDTSILLWPIGNKPPSSLSTDDSILLVWQHEVSPGSQITVVAGTLCHSDESSASNPTAGRVSLALNKLVDCPLRCRECLMCIASPLCILDVSLKPCAQQTSGSKSDDAARGQLILYNPQEAQEWHTWRSVQPLHDLWYEILLQVGLCSQIMENLDAILKSKDRDPIISLQNKTSCSHWGHNTCKHLEEHNEVDSVANKSLLFLHMKTCEIRATSSSEEGMTMKMIPLYNLIQALSSHNHKPSKQHPKSQNLTLLGALIIDTILGWILGSTCLMNSTSILRIISSSWHQYNHIWNCGLTWLKSNPLGVKMNEALTEHIVHGTEWLLNHHPLSILLSTTTNIIPHYYATAILSSIGILTIIFGSRFFFAFTFDTSRLVFYHIRFLSRRFAQLQSIEYSILSSLWLLFRGKKRNVLRMRSDHLHYDHMQLLLGMLLFSMCIFLFTTVLVHHWFFLGVQVVHECIICGFWVGFAGVESLFCVDRILWEGRRDGCEGVSLTSVSLEDDDVMDTIDNNACIKNYFDGMNPCKDTNHAVNMTNISQNVRMESFPYVVSRMTFQVDSDSSIVIKVLTSFLTSRLARMAVFLPKMIACGCSEMVFSCISISTSLQRKL